MEKQIYFDDDANAALKAGVNKAANAIGSTMGAAGRTVIISDKPKFSKDGSLVPARSKVTKDGVTVAASIVLKDEVENIGAQMIREASEATYFDAGDGTTQTAVLAQSIINNGLKEITSGRNPVEVKRGIELAVEEVVKHLKLISKDIGDDNQMIKNIATTSANNDGVIGGLIADAYKKIGKSGLLHIEHSSTIHTTIEVVEGYEMPRGYMSPDFATDPKKRAIHRDALVLVTDYTIHTMKDLLPLLQQLEAKNLLSKPLIIVAQDYDGEFYSSMLINHRDGRVRNCLIKAPITYRREHLEDLAIMTGATVIRDENGLKLDSIQLHHLGSAEKVIVTEYTTTIFGGGGKKEAIEDLQNGVKVQMEEMKDEQLKLVWEKRLAKIAGRIAVIKVGAPTDVEQKEKVDRVDDACRAVKSAIEEGVLPGGGVALLRCVDAINNCPATGGDESAGYKIIKDACMAPLERMLKNAGVAHETVVKDIYLEKELGYNVKTRKYEDLMQAGVVDPTKVIRCAIQNAASVAGAVLGSACVIVEVK